MDSFEQTLTKFVNIIYTPSVVKHLKKDFAETDLTLARSYIQELHNHGSKVGDLYDIITKIESKTIDHTAPASKYLEYWFRKVINERYRNSWKAN